MAPGHTRLILVREMNVLEHVQRHFLIFRSLYQRSAVERLGRGRRVLPFPSTSAGGRILDQDGNKVAPSNRRPLAEIPVRTPSNRTREGAA